MFSLKKAYDYHTIIGDTKSSLKWYAFFIVFNLAFALTLMLLVVNLANTELCKKTEK